MWSLLVLLAVTTWLAPSFMHEAWAQEQDEQEDHEAGPRHVLVLVPEPPAEATVHQRIHFTPPFDEPRTVTVGVPRDADHWIQADQAQPVSWSEAASGVLYVAVPPEATFLEVTSRGIKGLAEGQPLRFGQTDRTAPLWLTVGVPGTLNATAFDLARVDTVMLRQTGAVPIEWPLPADWDYAWNSGLDDALPESMQAAPVQLQPALAPYALGAGMIVVLALLTLWLVARIHRGVGDPTRTKKQPVMRHLEELRKRLSIVVLVLLAATAFFFSFGFRWREVARILIPVPLPSLHHNAASQVFAWLADRIVPAGVDVVVVAPFDAVVTLLVLSFALGVLVTFPVLAYHVYAFLAPALYPNERRLVLVSSPVVVGLFGLGAFFGLLFMAPLIVMVLYGFAVASGAIAFLTMPQLVSIAALMALMFAIAFQLPLVMMLTARIGIVRAEAYRRQWRWALVIIVVVSALVTDPTVVTQIIVAAVLFALYGVGLVLASIADRKRIPSMG